MKIDFNQIINQSLTAFVVAIILGAGAIVWNGATSVDLKVQLTRQDMEHLITSLSEKLADYEVQQIWMSNQLCIILNNQQSLLSIKNPQSFENSKSSSSSSSSPIIIPERDDKIMQQKAYSQDILKQLRR